MSKSMDDMVGDADISISCPKCTKGLLIEAKQIGATVTCPHCGACIEPQDGEGISDAIKAPHNFEGTFDFYCRG